MIKHIYCSDRSLLGRLVQLHAAVRVAAFHEDLKRRRYREISSTLRSIDARLATYCKPAPIPIFLVGKGVPPQFYVRKGNTSRPLDVKRAYEYIREHWK